MPHAGLNRELIACLMRMIDAGVITIAQAAEFAPCVVKTMQRHRKQWLLHNHQLPPELTGYKLGRPRKLSAKAVLAMDEVIAWDPLADMDDIHDDMVDLGFGSISNSLISRTKKRLGITTRRSSAYAHAQSASARADYMRMIGQYQPQQLVFVDESSFDYRVCNRRKALGHRGDRTWVRTVFQRGKRYSLLAACSLSIPMFAAIINAENMDGLDFGRWCAEALIPMCQVFPLERSVVVMDNCAIHKLEGTQRLFADAGVKLVFLPPYSPDYNPIEKAWSKIKAVMKKLPRNAPIVELIAEATSQVTASDIQGFYRFSNLV